MDFPVEMVQNVSKALPPWVQEQREKEAITRLLYENGLCDERETLQFSKDETGLYQIETTLYLIDVQVVYEPMEMCGPAKFHLELLDIIEKN